MRRTLRAISALVLVALIGGHGGPAGAQPPAEPSPQYLLLARARQAGQPVGCVDVHWATQQGLLAPVEVRWLGELGLRCPDPGVVAEHIPSEQYVVMLALAVRGELTCADVEWNAAYGQLTWSAVVNLLGSVAGCPLSQYARMVALSASGRLTCDDVAWNRAASTISGDQAGWLAAAIGCPAGPPVRWLATYRIGVWGDPGADVEEFRRQAAETLADPRGWRRAGVAFREIPPEVPDAAGGFTLWLAEAAAMGAFGCGGGWSCTVGADVVINATRWLEASPSWNEAAGTLRDYRHLVVNHEVGHWLGLGHLGCPEPGGPAAVMQQQSIDLAGCRFNPWPLDAEVAAVP